MKFLYRYKKFLIGRLAIFIFGEKVVKIDQWIDLFTKSNLLANRLTHWPRIPTYWPIN